MPGFKNIASIALLFLLLGCIITVPSKQSNANGQIVDGDSRVKAFLDEILAIIEGILIDGGTLVPEQLAGETACFGYDEATCIELLHLSSEQKLVAARF